MRTFRTFEAEAGDDDLNSEQGPEGWLEGAIRALEEQVRSGATISFAATHGDRITLTIDLEGEREVSEHESVLDGLESLVD